LVKFELIRESDMAALLRIVGEVTELPADKTVRRTHVLKALLDLIGGRSGVGMEMASPDEGPLARPGTIININTSSLAEGRCAESFLLHNNPPDPALPQWLAARGQTLTIVRHVADDEFYRSAHYDVVRRPFDIDHSLYCRLTLPDGRDFCVGLQRCPGDPLFTQREQSIVHFLHCHAPHIYHVRPPASGSIEQFAPRLRPVMRYLLQGDAEKQIALKMRLSPHTVHRYTQAIYRQVQVSSRGELLAKCSHWA
jgi:DNA-binding CsgD family transcriptional regulator